MSKHKIIGIVLILSGFVCAVALILCTLHHAEYMWNAEMKSRNFASFADYYFTFSKGALLLSGGIGAIFISLGIYCLAKHRS